MIEWQICGGIMFLLYAIEDNIERKKNMTVKLYLLPTKG
jgi:hypothetical protein